MFFKDNYAFLSNMYECKVQVCIGNDSTPYIFKCVESTFQACKCPERVQEFINLNGYQAKKLGRQVNLRADWEQIKVDCMKSIVKAKFDQNRILKLRLISLKECIIEDNTWNDTFWGVCNGIGDNVLGKILMDLRDYYNPFYCLVVGSRNFDNYELMRGILDYLLQNKKYVVIVSGGAKGADSLAERYANEHNYRLKVFPANWDKYGKSAGYKRNEQMHLYISAPSDKDRGVVAFWDGSSKGTAHNFELSLKYDNPIKIYNYSINSFVSNPLSGI